MKEDWEKIFVWGIAILIAYNLYSRLATPPTVAPANVPQAPGAANIVPNLNALATNAFDSLFGATG
jgi:hypothetical protein